MKQNRNSHVIDVVNCVIVDIVVGVVALLPSMLQWTLAVILCWCYMLIHHVVNCVITVLVLQCDTAVAVAVAAAVAVAVATAVAVAATIDTCMVLRSNTLVLDIHLSS